MEQLEIQRAAAQGLGQTRERSSRAWNPASKGHAGLGLGFRVQGLIGCRVWAFRVSYRASVPFLSVAYNERPVLWEYTRAPMVSIVPQSLPLLSGFRVKGLEDNDIINGSVLKHFLWPSGLACP